MKNVVYILLLSVLVASCSKENSDVFQPYTNNPLNDTTWVEQPAVTSSVNRLTEIFSTATKSDSIEVSVGATMKVSEFLEVTLPPLFAKFSNGAAVQGKARVEVTFLRRKGDYIRFDRPTTSFGKILESGGAVFIRVIKEGQELIPDAARAITLRIRDVNPLPNMKVFYGEQALTSANASSFNWVQSTDTSGNVKIYTKQDSSGIYYGYEFVTKKFNWVNCDRFIDSTLPKTRISAVLPPNFTSSNTAVYAVFKDQKIIVRLNAEYLTRSFFAVNMPIGKKITLVSISKIGDDLYLATKDPIVEANLRVSLTPERKTKAEIDTFLDAL